MELIEQYLSIHQPVDFEISNAYASNGFLTLGQNKDIPVFIKSIEVENDHETFFSFFKKASYLLPNGRVARILIYHCNDESLVDLIFGCIQAKTEFKMGDIHIHGVLSCAHLEDDLMFVEISF